MGFELSNEMFINMKPSSIPPWKKGMPYWEQDIETILFWENELKKIREGIVVGGYFVHPWLYFHVNFFKSPIPTIDGDKIMNAPLDDNFLYTIETYIEADEKDLGVCMFGTRGFAKSTILASLTQWSCSKQPDGYAEVYGGSSEDLVAITDLVRLSVENTVDPFKLHTKRKDWGDLIYFSLVEKGTNEEFSHSSIRVKIVKDSTKFSEKGAGGNSSCFIVDEIGKFDPRPLLDSVLPAFRNRFGMRMVPFLSGTGGNAELSQGAKEILENPAGYEMLPMNFDRLDRFTDLDYIDWSKEKKRTFCTFVPGHMSYRLKGLEKKEVPLGEFLDKDSKELNDIKINVTDWEDADEKIDLLIEGAKNEASRNKVRMYYPRTLDDCFLTDSPNPFPLSLAIKKLTEVRQNPQYRKVDVERNDKGSGFVVKVSDKKLAERAYKGMEVDAPFLLFGDFPETIPPKYTYVAGLDDYKLAQSTTDSLGCVYIISRRNLEINNPIEQIVLSIADRPQKHNIFHSKIEKGLSAFNALCNMESIDTGFISFLENTDRNPYDYLSEYLNPSHDLLSKERKRSRNRSKFGTYPTTENNAILIKTVIEYCWQEVNIGLDENGRPIIKYGIEFIEDPLLLEEIVDYKTNAGNYDRIQSFGMALLLSRNMDKNNIIAETEDRGLKDFEYDFERKPKNNKRFVNYSNVRFKNF